MVLLRATSTQEGQCAPIPWIFANVCSSTATPACPRGRWRPSTMSVPRGSAGSNSAGAPRGRSLRAPRAMLSNGDSPTSVPSAAALGCFVQATSTASGAGQFLRDVSRPKGACVAVKLTKIGLPEPQDIVREALLNTTCWASCQGVQPQLESVPARPGCRDPQRTRSASPAQSAGPLEVASQVPKDQLQAQSLFSRLAAPRRSRCDGDFHHGLLGANRP